MARLNYRVQIEFDTDASIPSEAATKLERLGEFGTVTVKSVTRRQADRNEHQPRANEEGTEEQPAPRRFFGRS